MCAIFTVLLYLVNLHNFNKVRIHNLFQNLLLCIFIFDRLMLLRPPNVCMTLLLAKHQKNIHEREELTHLEGS